MTTAAVQRYLANPVALARLIEEHGILKSAVEQSPMQFCVYNAQEEMVAWNKAYAALHPKAFNDHPEDEYISLRKIALSHAPRGASADEQDQIVRTFLARQNVEAVHQEEHYFEGFGWLNIVRYPLGKGATGAVALDINELKSREAELENARKRAEEGERVKSEFLANMSHEMRTPLNGIIGIAELLGRTGLDATQKMYLDVVQKSGVALLNILTDVLDVSQIESGELQLCPAPFDLAAVAEDIAVLCAPAAHEQGIELMLRIDPKLPDLIIGDEARVRQILLNLANNAVKYTTEGHVLIEVAAETVTPDQTNIRLVIKDTGCGISPENQATVFDPFTQIHGADGRPSGIGMGLAITAKLVNLMDGKISVESEVGKGSRFGIAASFFHLEHETPQKKQHAPKRALIIDPCIDRARILEEQIRALGGQATVSPALSQQLPRGGAFDLVCIDDTAVVDTSAVARLAANGAAVIRIEGLNTPTGNQMHVDARIAKPLRPSQFHAVIANCAVRSSSRLDDTKRRHAQ